MPNSSMFGRPSQYLLPLHPPANERPNPTKQDPHAAPPEFKDFRFNSIGKQPELLSRISLPQPEHMDYHSPTPSPPPSNLTNSQSRSSSRPTLLQQLAGKDSNAMDQSPRRLVPTTHSDGSLASRIQTSANPSGDNPGVHCATAGVSLSPLSVNNLSHNTGDADLIPPVEVLPQPPDSPVTAASSVPSLRQAIPHTPVSSTLPGDTTSIRAPRIPTPTVTTAVVSTEQLEQPLSLRAVDDKTRDLEPKPSVVSAINSLVARRERLRTISDNLANLNSLPPLPSSHFSSPDPPVVQTDDPTSNQLQPTTTPIVLPPSPSTNQSHSRLGLGVASLQTHTNSSSPILVPSTSVLSQDYQTQCRAFTEAAQNLSSAFDALRRIQVDSENAFTHQIQTFGEQRVAFEQMKRTEVAALQQRSQELQQKWEEQHDRESYLALLEKESRTREDAWKGTLARRHAQEEERRAAESKRTQELQELIDLAIKELSEANDSAQSIEGPLGKLAGETIPDDVPAEYQEGMSEEEIAAIKSHNNLLRDMRRLRQLHAKGSQNLEESSRTLRRLQEKRKRRLAEEAEGRRIVEEERLRALAEAERARQAKDEKQRQHEAERKRRAATNGLEHTPHLAEQQAHLKIRDRVLGSTETTGNRTFEHHSHLEGIELQQQAISDTTGTRVAHHKANSHPPAVDSMNVDPNERASTAHRTVALPDIHVSPTGLQDTTSPPKQTHESTSGGARHSVPTSKVFGGDLPPKRLAKPPSRPSSDHGANASRVPSSSPALPISAEGGHRSSFPVQLASEFNRLSDADIRSTPDHRSSFPRTPKLQTILDATNGGSQEVNIGPAPGVLPTHQNVNLRHLKWSRGRVEENDVGDHSVRVTNVKSEESMHSFVKREGVDNHSGELAPVTVPTGHPPSLPPRPPVIPTPRPWMSKKRHAAPLPPTDSTNSSPYERNKKLTREAAVTTNERPQDNHRAGANLVSRAIDVPMQQSTPAKTMNSLLLGPVNLETQSTETRVGRPTRGAENHDTTSSEPTSVSLSHKFYEKDWPKNDRGSSDEYHRTHNENRSRRPVDHYPPPLAMGQSITLSSTHSSRPIESQHPQDPSNGPRAEPMRATSPIAGKKRAFEFNDNDYGHRARRQRDDAWESDRSRRDFYRLPRDRRVDSELDERRTAYRAPPSPDPIIQLPDMPMMTYDDSTYVPFQSGESTIVPTRREQFHRRPERDDTYRRYQPPVPGRNAVVDQYQGDNVRAGQIYEPTVEDVQPEPPLLARMSTTQRFPPTTSSRVRGRGEPSKGRADSRGRGRGNATPARGGAPLIERLTNGPSSLGDRLT